MSKLIIHLADQEFEVEINSPPDAEGFTSVSVNGEALRVAIAPAASPDATEWAIVDTRPYEVLFDRDMRSVQSIHGRHELRIRDLEAGVARPRSGDGRIKAPIPGIIANVLVELGQNVSVGEPILILEAMKMQNEITAPRAGAITTLNVQPGQTVVLHELLVEIS
ncbi:acetyl-CoA carboxylase biotin carboxyl carrier protein subunit [Candidatus Viridilinea mediisalina]|uniref:Acetyl-CoA carboxylase biotin carboxyl carrier protein subunit n=1 Tax=Candidatus Viridilinea mediisalina TaxID=2024553 RepID=A0A2A6RLP5_9CHLR|nr:acetyl-CoA carboxylase biotin carboxyl carrier protein subunit [Candidatus Viridilinea mediisalina]PDW03863.1 acetyl-CoA carboxylase biotin carboxyl carrier protein subunit [Candidatus Viridilinea mediisalina]